MAVKITDNTPQVSISTERGISLAIRYMLDGIDQIANPRTPKDTNRLRSDITKQVLGKKGTITWHKKYAQAQEAGIIHGSPVRNYTTPGTGPHFAENAVRQVVEDSGTYFRKAGLI